MNISAEIIPGIASALGAGMCGRGETCGIANGCLMGIGLKYGRRKPDDMNDITYYAGSLFLEKFYEIRKTFNCRDITGLDFEQPGSEEIWYSEILDKTCAPLMVESLNILGRILEELHDRNK